MLIAVVEEADEGFVDEDQHDPQLLEAAKAVLDQATTNP
jgi:hypothetical protein